MLAHYQSLVLRRDSGKYFNLVVKEVIRVLLYEIVVYCVVVIDDLLIFEIADLFCALVELAVSISAKVNDFY